MASDSDSDCELYTKTAEHVKFESKVGEIEDVRDMASDREMGQFLVEVESGMAPMDALIKVQMMEYMSKKAPLNETDAISLLESNDSDLTSNSSPLSDGPVELLNIIKKENRSLMNKSVATRASTRPLTKASTSASLAKANRYVRISPKNNIGSASNEVDNVGEVGSGFVTQGPGRKRGLQSNANRNVSKRLHIQTAPSSSNARDLGSIVFDDDSGYDNTVTTPIDFNRPYNAKLSLSLNSDSSSDTEEQSYDDIPVKITIEWSNAKGLTRKLFQLRKYQKFESVFEDLAKLEGISVNRVVLMKQFTSINPKDTPETTNMKFYGALTGFVSPTEIVHGNMYSSLADEFEISEKKPEGAISVQVQLETKQKLVFTIVKHNKMETLYLMTCEELKCDKDKLKLVFDGEYVSPNEKLSNLDIEDGDLFHAYIKK